MKKLLICKFGTVFFGFLAIGVFSRFASVLPLYHGDLLGASLAIVSAIFGTQWIEYRKRTVATASQPTHANPIRVTKN